MHDELDLVFENCACGFVNHRPNEKRPGIRAVSFCAEYEALVCESSGGDLKAGTAQQNSARARSDCLFAMAYEYQRH